jgi:putative membrane-bound dehydrogenase-like protein
MQLPPSPLTARAVSLAALFGLALAPASRAEDPLPNVERLRSSPVLQHLKPNPVPRPGKTGPQQTVAQMYVPEGFQVDLVVGEPDLHQPVAFAFDERGRIWVAEAYSYPTKRPAGQGEDKLVIFEDKDGDGSFETRKVFAEGLNLVSGFEVGHGGVWVGAAPELLFIADKNHDDVPDGAPQVLLDGFGYQDTHECLNSFLWGPDGWLYGIQGVFNLAHIGKPGAKDTERTELRAGVWRYHPVRHQFEVFAHGGSNPWGLDYDEHGELFMTHCRSYWGRGGTTHVMQGGQFWNQANANYAPFIVANPPADFPAFRNFLLASARYDHGAGGAGVRGSDAIYGGHSHVGTMIYLGDNWPDEFRGHLFTHNLHGHQINQQVNLREASGYNTVHAGKDQFFCSDPKYVAVDLQYGPDGAVYFIDWYDPQHCHNPNTERWDRTNGRLYRMQWQATYKPVTVDLAAKSDDELADLLTHKNAWYARTAKRLLGERGQWKRPITSTAKAKVESLARKSPDAPTRLLGLWTANEMGMGNSLLAGALKDSDEFVRGWAVQLATEDGNRAAKFSAELVRLAAKDPSPVVRRFLASAIQRVPAETGWKLATALAQRAEDKDDRNLPLLLWHGLAPLMAKTPDKAFFLASRTAIPVLKDWIYWYGATLEGEPLNHVIRSLGRLDGEDLRRRLAGVWLAMEPRANMPHPEAWKETAAALYANPDRRLQRDAERLAAVFGDSSMFPRLRTTLADRQATPDDRKHAFAVLNRAQDAAALPVFLTLLDDDAFRTPVISLLGRFNAAEIAPALLSRFAQFNANDRSAVLATLTSRPTFALALLDAVASGSLKRDLLTAFHVRQLAGLNDAEVTRRVIATWGRIGNSPAEKEAAMAKLQKTFDEAPLWAYSANEGRKHFQKLCMSCHVLGQDGQRLGPELTGAGKNGIRYFLENVMDPNAVIGTDFQMTTVETKAGDTISGLILSETGSALTLRTTTEQVVVAKSDIAKRETSDRSLMPEGLLESLPDREQIELLKYLTGN